MGRNPFLPQLPKKPIRWRIGAAKGTVGIPSLQPAGSEVPQPVPAALYRKDPRGRKPKDQSAKSLPVSPPEPRPKTVPSRPYFKPGARSYGRENFFCESNSGWGSNIDMVPLAHGAVGCSAFAQTSRLNLPALRQGIESFTALDVCTNLQIGDLEDGGDAKLSAALGEIETLFPLARGTAILNEEPIPFIDANVKGLAKAATKSSGKLVVPVGCGVYTAFNWTYDVANGLKAAVRYAPDARRTSLDVALTFCRTTPGLVWIVAKLLSDIGLNPILERTGSSASDMARIANCKLVIGFSENLDAAPGQITEGNAHLLHRWFGIPLIWTSFVSPDATDESLRAIAGHFGPKIQRRADTLISLNRRKIAAIIARFRPQLEGRLVLDFMGLPEAHLECYRMLGMRVGTAEGWPGKTGVWRKPRLIIDPDDQSAKAIDSYIAEAKPDIVLYFRRHEQDWRKRGQSVVPFSPLFDHKGDSHWGYEGFACLAAALDRAVNAPWRRLVKPPWPPDSG